MGYSRQPHGTPALVLDHGEDDSNYYGSPNDFARFNAPPDENNYINVTVGENCYMNEFPEEHIYHSIQDTLDDQIYFSFFRIQTLKYVIYIYILH